MEKQSNKEKGTWVGADLDALAFFARVLIDVTSDAAIFAKLQPRERQNRIELTGVQTQFLTQMTTRSRLQELLHFPDILMGYAESETRFKGSKRFASRLQNANLSAAISIQLDLLLHPGELVTLVSQPGNSELTIKSSDGVERQILKDELSQRSKRLLKRRDALRSKLKRPSNLLFPGDNLTTLQLDRSVCSSLGKVFATHGFQGVTMQVLRDVGAVTIIKQDPTKIRHVMVLLGLKSIRSVQRRYAPFLKGVQWPKQ